MEKSSSKGLIIKIAVALLIILIGVGSLLLYNHYTKPKPLTYETRINIVIKAKDGTTLHDDSFEGINKTLVDILNENYECKMELSQFGYKLLEIEELKTNFITSYIEIRIDGEYANVGISGIKLYDGIVITFTEVAI